MKIWKKNWLLPSNCNFLIAISLQSSTTLVKISKFEFEADFHTLIWQYGPWPSKLWLSIPIWSNNKGAEFRHTFFNPISATVGLWYSKLWILQLAWGLKYQRCTMYTILFSRNQTINLRLMNYKPKRDEETELMSLYY